jgi:UDP-MurNAc hydroxylase
VRIEWVNHASFIVESGAVRLICDPWLEGSAFNDGWNLLSPTKLSYDDFSKTTHIWFSHEHPDHFSPMSLRKIPEVYRRKIKVLFHCTSDQQVVDLCKSLGFITEELPDNRIVTVAEDFKVLSGRQGLLDSWICVWAEGKTLLNMNDCVFDTKRELEMLQRSMGKTDILFSQFSYANWVGNPGDLAAHKRQANRKREEMERQIRVFEPSLFIPFASFVYFSHAENFFMNQCVNQINDVYEFVTQDLRVPCNVMYPGDQWEIGTPWDSRPSIERYQADYARVLASTPIASAQVSFGTLQEAANIFVRKCSPKNNWFLLKALPPAVVRISDLGIEGELSFRRGLVETRGRCPDIILSSDSLLYCLKTDWGGETLQINGRFQVPAGGKPRRFFWMFRVPRHNARGNSLNFRFLCQRMLQRLRGATAS